MRILSLGVLWGTATELTKRGLGVVGQKSRATDVPKLLRLLYDTQPTAILLNLEETPHWNTSSPIVWRTAGILLPIVGYSKQGISLIQKQLFLSGADELLLEDMVRSQNILIRLRKAVAENVRNKWGYSALRRDAGYPYRLVINPWSPGTVTLNDRSIKVTQVEYRTLLFLLLLSPGSIDPAGIAQELSAGGFRNATSTTVLEAIHKLQAKLGPALFLQRTAKKFYLSGSVEKIHWK